MSCGLRSDRPNVTFATANGPVEFQFPAGWYKNTDEHPFDLQCFSKDQSMNTGVFLYNKKDLATRSDDPRELLKDQIDDLRSKRENFKVIREMDTIDLEGKSLTTVVYSGERNSETYHYRFTVIRFKDHPEHIPLVLQVSLADRLHKAEPIFDEILRSARTRADG